MRGIGVQTRSRPIALFWVAAALALGVATLGLVHHASAERARERALAQPLKPLAVIDLARNRGARKSDSASADAWRAAAVALGREVETFSGAGLGEIPATRFAAWILPEQTELDDADFAALDSYLQLGGGVVLSGRTGHKSAGRSALLRLFPGQRFAEPGASATRLRVTGRGPLVAGLAAGEEIAVAEPARGLSASSGDALAWSDDVGAAGLHAIYRGAPIAWLGFSPDQIREPRQSHVLAENALRFALREPVLDLLAWPEGRPCAVLVDGVTERAAASVACRIDGQIAGADALRSLTHAGCRYAAVSPDGRALPELLDVDGSPLVAIPEGRAQAAVLGSELMRELLTGYERAERLGGVYSLRADAGWRAAAGREALFTRVRNELRERGAWFADPDALADWWGARSHVRAELAQLARDRVRVTFSNGGSAQARAVTARVYLPEGAATARIESRPSLRASPLLRISADHSWIDIVEPSLDPGSEVSYTIRF
ncbi:MAG: hypothetical protein ACHQ6T_15660 [Myxococcota bacterium]